MGGKGSELYSGLKKISCIKPLLQEASLAHQAQVASHLLVPLAPCTWVPTLIPHQCYHLFVCLYSILDHQLLGSRNGIPIVCLSRPETVLGTG